MSGGSLKAGSVYVAVSASIGEFAKSMQAIIKSVEDTAKKVKESAAAVAAVGNLFASGIQHAVQAATVANESLGADIKRIQTLIYTLAGDLGELFAPAIRSISAALGKVVAFVQSLDASTKKSIASFALFAAGTGVAAGGVSKTAALVEGLAKAAGVTLVPALGAASSAAKYLGQISKEYAPVIGRLSKSMLPVDGDGAFSAISKSVGRMALAFSSALLPILVVVGAVAAIGLAAGAIYKAWNDTSTGLRDSVMEMVSTLQTYAQRVAGFFRDLFEGLRNFFKAIAVAMLEVVLFKVRLVALALENLAKAAGANNIAKDLAQIQSITGESVLAAIEERMVQVGQLAGEALTKGVEAVADVGKAAAQNVVESVSSSASGLKQLLGDAYKASGLDSLLDKVQETVGRLTGAGDPKLRETAEDKKAGEDLAEWRKGLAADVAKAGEESRAEYLRAGRADMDAAAASFRAIREDAQRMAEAAASARDSLASKFTAKLGGIMDLVDSFTQGLAASGGNPVAAVGAVVADLLTQSRGFAEVMAMVSNTIHVVADAVGSVLVPLQPLVAAVLNVVAVVANSLRPVFEVLYSVTKPFVPVLALLGEVLKVLQPLFTMLAGVIQIIQLPLRLLVEVQLRAFFEALKWLGVGLMYVAQAISWVWNGIVDAITWVLRQIAKLPFLDGLKAVADELDAVRVDRGALKDATQELISLTWEQAKAKAEETEATLKNTEALKDANEALTNVPSAWNRALRERQAQDKRGGGGGQSPPLPGTGALPSPVVAPVVVNVVTFTPEEREAVLERQRSNRNLRLGYGGYR